MIGINVQNMLRAAAGRLANLADRADDWETGIDPNWEANTFAGVDFVGIDFSTSIMAMASHVIRGWDRYRSQMDALQPDHGVSYDGDTPDGNTMDRSFGSLSRF